MRKLLAAAGLLILFTVVLPARASAGVVVYPYPIVGDQVASPETQIAFRGVPASALGTITVTGSISGPHPGIIDADPDGDGGSFVPSTAFHPGETVTVSTSLPLAGAPSGTYHFTVAIPEGGINFQHRQVAARAPGDVDHFRSAPELLPPSVHLDVNRAGTTGGDILLAPQQGPLQWGPMILDAHGGLIWWDPLPGNDTAANLQVQSYDGQPVLTWWQGQTGSGVGVGADVVMNANYQIIATVRAADGLSADLHEFRLLPGGKALITAEFPVVWNAEGAGGSATQDVFDGVVQEIDVKTGLLLYQWDSLDHVPVQASYEKPRAKRPYDYFHLNSVQPDANGNLLISSRNTSAAYDIDAGTGSVLWELGGKQSSFTMGPGTTFSFQHDVEISGPGDDTITMFDDAGGPPRSAIQSSALTLHLDYAHHQATRTALYTHNPGLVADYEGNAQPLSNGNMFVGWGQAKYFTEFSASGQELLDGRFVGPNTSYRAYTFPWSAAPLTHPEVALTRGANGNSTVYASWNGATAVARWRVLAGPSQSTLRAIADQPRRAFETALTVASESPYLQVQALGSSGQLLSSSPVAGGTAARLSVFGAFAYTLPSGLATVRVGCFAASSCPLNATISVPGVGSATGYSASPKDGGAVIAVLLPAAVRARLAGAGAAGLKANLTVTGPHGSVVRQPITLARAAAVTPPATPVRQSPEIQLISRTAFVGPTGHGTVFVACHAATPCRAHTTLRIGGAVVAQTGPEIVGAGDCGILVFGLGPGARRRLASSPAHHLLATVTITNRTAHATGQIVLDATNSPS